MNKELRPGLEEIVCQVCGRTMLKGERAEPYLVGGGQRRLVCELCTDRAYAAGWIRESAHDELPASLRRPEPRRSLLGRLRRRPGDRTPAEANAGDGRPAQADGAAVDGDPPHQPEPELAGDQHRETASFKL